jgi:hypothetical protein
MLELELTPIRGFFLLFTLIGFVVWTLGGCGFVMGAMDGFAGQYNDSYVDSGNDDDDRKKQGRSIGDDDRINKDKNE